MYAVTLIASALAVCLFLAPVSFHRIIYRQKLRDRMLPIANRMTIGGMLLLIVAIAGGVLLAADVVLSRPVAIIVVAVVLLLFALFWYVVPAWVRRTNADEE